MLSQLSHLTGIWSQEINFDGETFWRDGQHFPHQVQYDSNVLASNSYYRQDVTLII